MFPFNRRLIDTLIAGIVIAALALLIIGICRLICL